MDYSTRSLVGYTGAGTLAIRTAPTPAPAPVVDLVALQAASRVLQEQHNKDATIIPDLGDMLTIPGRPSSSSYSIFPDDYRVPFQKKRLSGIPEDVFKFYSAARHTTYMGLLPKIERVWISIDHQLILWDYVEGQELNTFAEQSDTISHVALVQPKPGVFIDDIQHLLVICTPVSVLLLGIQEVPAVGANGRPRKELKVYATGMSVSTDVQMTSVIGTADGRIFMCGSQDGHLYELHYQEREGWFGKRIQIVNHSIGGVQSLLPMFTSTGASDRIVLLVSDIERDYFYTLTENSVISIYKPSGEKTVQLIQTISNIYKSAQDKAPGSPALTPSTFRIIALHVVQPSESRVGVQIVAVTTNGVRLYFSASSTGYGYSYGATTASNAPRHLQLIHVRLPPAELLHPDEQSRPYRAITAGPGGAGQATTSRPYQLSGLEISCYNHGVTLAAQAGDTDAQDYLLCMSPDLTRIGTLGQTQPPQVEPPLYAGAVSGPQRLPLAEYATLIPVQGRTWDIAATPRPSITTFPGANELAVQFSEPSRNFMVLTSAGISFLAKRRPLDYLKDVLEEVHADQNYQPIVHFRDSFGRDQTCAMLLGLASGNTFLELVDLTVTGTLTQVSPELVNLAKQAFYDFGDRPMYTERVTYGTSDATGSTTFSGRREGLAIYFARLVRPIWKHKLTQTGPLGLQQLTASEDLLVTIQKNLFALKDFLDQNPQLFHSAPGEHTGARSAAASEQDAWRMEQKSVSQLQALLARTTEAISFVLLLNDYKIGELIAQADAEVQKTIASMSYEELIVAPSGVAAARALVNIVIDQQIGQQIGVDTVSEILQSRCGSFCSTDDVMLYKAKENIRKAVESKHPSHRQELLGESLRLFIKGARILDFDKLREVIGDYQHLQYAKGAVELPLYSAQIEDPDNQGLTWWHTGAPSGDSRSEFWERRQRCYDLVLDSLAVFDEQQAKAGPTTGHSPRNLAFELALSAEDEGFHSALYDWLIQRGLADQLLEMQPPYLEAHLRREPTSVDKYQLLWQFYVKAGAPLRAAEVLGTLAESNQFDLDLNARLECLTLAVGNAKSHPVSAGGRHETALAYLTDLEEKLEVAQVQLEIYHMLLPRLNESGAVGERIRLLQKTLLNISDLYTEYAEPFDLAQIKLLVLHVSDHRDDGLSRSIWNSIFEEAIGEDDDIGAPDRIAAKVIPLGQRFFPSDSAFPLRHVSSTLVRFALAHKQTVPPGWAPRVLVQCGVPPAEVWELLNEMYESQVPPFNEQANVQALSADLAVFLTDWAEEATRPQSAAAREFPVSRVDRAIDQYLEELEPSRTEVRAQYEAVKRQLRRYW